MTPTQSRTADRDWAWWVLSVPCSFCGAPIGNDCRTTFRGLLAKPHAARERAARERAAVAAKHSQDGALEELRDALDDAIRRAFCEPPIPPLSCEDAAIVRNTARAAIISNPDRMRHLASIQAAAWEVVRERVNG